MFSSIVVLAVTKNEETVRCLRAMSFTTIQCDRIEEVLDHMSSGDILFLDTDIQGGTDTSLMIISRWARDTQKPICMIRRTATREEIRTFRVQGVWDICEKWDDGIAELQAIFRRYGSIMLDIQKIEQLELAQQESNRKIKVLQRATFALALLIAALGGVEIIPKVVSLLPML